MELCENTLRVFDVQEETRCILTCVHEWFVFFDVSIRFVYRPLSPL